MMTTTYAVPACQAYPCVKPKNHAGRHGKILDKDRPRTERGLKELLEASVHIAGAAKMLPNAIGYQVVNPLDQAIANVEQSLEEWDTEVTP